LDRPTEKEGWIKRKIKTKDANTLGSLKKETGYITPFSNKSGY
jgi:hypothetical protein